MTTTTSLITLIVVAVIVLAVTEPNRALPAVSAMILAPIALHTVGVLAGILMQLAAIALVCISVMIADEENRVERIKNEMRALARGEVVR